MPSAASHFTAWRACYPDESFNFNLIRPQKDATEAGARSLGLGKNIGLVIIL